MRVRGSHGAGRHEAGLGSSDVAGPAGCCLWRHAGASRRQAVTLVAAFGSTDVTLFKGAESLLPEKAARLPSGTECTLIGTQSFGRSQGGWTFWLYQVDCDGAIGWVREPSLTFESEE